MKGCQQVKNFPIDPLIVNLIFSSFKNPITSFNHRPTEGEADDFHPSRILRLAISVANARILDFLVHRFRAFAGNLKFAA